MTVTSSTSAILAAGARSGSRGPQMSVPEPTPTGERWMFRSLVVQAVLAAAGLTAAHLVSPGPWARTCEEDAEGRENPDTCKADSPALLALAIVSFVAGVTALTALPLYFCLFRGAARSSARRHAARLATVGQRQAELGRGGPKAMRWDVAAEDGAAWEAYVREFGRTPAGRCAKAAIVGVPACLLLGQGVGAGFASGSALFGLALPVGIALPLVPFWPHLAGSVRGDKFHRTPRSAPESGQTCGARLELGAPGTFAASRMREQPREFAVALFHDGGMYFGVPSWGPSTDEKHAGPLQLVLGEENALGGGWVLRQWYVNPGHPVSSDSGPVLPACQAPVPAGRVNQVRAFLSRWSVDGERPLGAWRGLGQAWTYSFRRAEASSPSSSRA